MFLYRFFSNINYVFLVLRKIENFFHENKYDTYS
jgi:hypothetical protein